MTSHSSNFSFLSATVTVGDASVDGYSLKSSAGRLTLDRTGDEMTLVQIDGNVKTTGLILKGVEPDKVLSSGKESNTLGVSSFERAGIGNASFMDTGHLDAGFIVGDYGVGNVVVSDVFSATTLVGSANASSIIGGTIDDARLDGTYAFASLDVVGNVTAQTAAGNIRTTSVVTGYVDDARLTGSYGFTSLETTGNVLAVEARGNLDGARLVSGTLDPSRFQGSYAFGNALATELDADTVTLTSFDPMRIVASDTTSLVTTGVTVTESSFVKDVGRAVQDQLTEIENGLFVGNTIDNLDATQLTLGTLSDDRFANGASYSFENLFLSNALVAGNVDANLDASQLTTGIIDPARISGNYVDVNSLHIVGTIDASSISANLDASHVSTGTLPSERISGAYAFAALEVPTVNVSWVHANVDGERVVSGSIDPLRFGFESVGSDFAPGLPNRSLGAASPDAWSSMWTDGVAVDEIVLGTGLERGGVAMQLDLNSTSTNVLPASGDVTLGLPGTPWSLLSTTRIHTDDLRVYGNLLDGNADVLNFDLENVQKALLPRDDGYVIGSVDRPWETVVTTDIHVADATVTGAVGSSLVPGTASANLGAATDPWSVVHAANVEGLVDGNGVGDIWVVVDDASGTIEALDGVRLPSEPLALRFFDDETVGVDVSDPGSSLRFNGVLEMAPGNVMTGAPVVGGGNMLGRVDARWRDAYSNTSILPWGTVADPVVGNASIGDVECSTLMATNAVTASTLIGSIDGSQLTIGTLPPERFTGGTYTVSNVDVSGDLVANGGGGLVSGPIVPSVNATHDLGTSMFRFRDMYVSSSSINLGTSSLSETDGNVVISSNLVVTDGVSGSGFRAPLSIDRVDITDDTWTEVLDDTAVGLDGGYIQVHGVGFAPACLVQVGSVNASSTTFVSSSVLQCLVPARPSGTYSITVIRGDSVTATLPSAITYSDSVTWITSSNLGTVLEGQSFSLNLQAVSDSNVMYSNVTPLPVETSLDASTGQFSGNITSVLSSTLFSFDVLATDEEMQDTVRTFLLQLVVSLIFNAAAYTDASWNALTQTALDSNVSGVYWTIDGVGISEVTSVLVDGTPATSISALNDSLLRVTGPLKARGTYDVTLVTPATSKTFENGVVYSDVPTWITSSNLGTVEAGETFTRQLEAVSDSAIVSYANIDPLPPSSSLDEFGQLTGTNIDAPGEYTFLVAASDYELQRGFRYFTMNFLGSVFEAVGGSVTTSGVYTYHTFTTNDTLTVAGEATIEYVVIGAGGGGGTDHGGGGGAGQLLVGSAVFTDGTYTVTIGLGGVGGAGAGQAATSGWGKDGGSTSLGPYTAIGGGGGGNYYFPAGRSGASGGGAGGYQTGAGGAAQSVSTGYAGGSTVASNYSAAGGGGAGGVGRVPTGSAGSSAGGVGGAAVNVFGSFYGGGGGGGSYSGAGAAGGGGGAGAGGTIHTTDGYDASPNTGSGGGGGGGNNTTDGYGGGRGGSGLVIVRYLTSAMSVPTTIGEVKSTFGTTNGVYPLMIDGTLRNVYFDLDGTSTNGDTNGWMLYQSFGPQNLVDALYGSRISTQGQGQTTDVNIVSNFGWTFTTFSELNNVAVAQPSDDTTRQYHVNMNSSGNPGTYDGTMQLNLTGLPSGITQICIKYGQWHPPTSGWLKVNGTTVKTFSSAQTLTGVYNFDPSGTTPHIQFFESASVICIYHIFVR